MSTENGEFSFNLVKAESMKEIREGVFSALERYESVMPFSRDAAILIKPNLNSYMNAVTGNTTDLRLLGAVIEFLKDRGYANITIGEGTNSGFYRNNISVISSLVVDRLAEHLGVKVIDLNYSQKVPVEFENGITAHIAKEVAGADFLINMPKLKTHFEAGMSVCLKNLMGCLVGQENKKKTHKSLACNILNINKKVRPNIHIVDGLIAMEGLGPTRGTPIKTGFFIVGNDPYVIDLACAKIARFDSQKITTLKRAGEEGLLNGGQREFVEALDLSSVEKKFDEPVANPLVSFIHSPERQPFFLAIRNTWFFTWLASTRWFGYLLFLSGLRQDNFIKEEMVFEGLECDTSKCKDNCTKCADYCPVGLKLPEDFSKGDSACIGCLYCYLVCPEKTVEFKGRLGFMAEQVRQYGEITRRVA